MPPAYAGCSDSTNYAPPANAKCMRNKPRARMPPNGRNCVSPPLPPSTSRHTRASRRCLMHVCTRYSKILAPEYKAAGAARAGGERARVNVPRGSLVSFSTLISPMFRRSPSYPETVFVPRFLVLLYPLIRDFFSPLLLLCIIPVTRRGGILHT